MHIGNIVFLFRVNIVLNRTESIVVDSDWRFDNLCGSTASFVGNEVTAYLQTINWNNIWNDIDVN